MDLCLENRAGFAWTGGHRGRASISLLKGKCRLRAASARPIQNNFSKGVYLQAKVIPGSPKGSGWERRDRARAAFAGIYYYSTVSPAGVADLRRWAKKPFSGEMRSSKIRERMDVLGQKRSCGHMFKVCLKGRRLLLLVKLPSRPGATSVTSDALARRKPG